MSGSAYSPELRQTFDARRPPGDGDLTPEFADVGRLVRRGVRAVVGAARAEERPALARILDEHLGGVGDQEVVEESWPGYEHVNVQAGLDAWLTGPGRTAELVGVVGYQHRQFGLAEVLAGGDRKADPYGPRPGPPGG